MALDPITLATVSGVASAVFTQLAPYLKKGAETLTSEVAKSLWAKVTSVFKKPHHQEKLEAWKADPDNKDLTKAAAHVLEDALHEDNSLLEALREELKKLPSIKVESDDSIIQIGNNNKAIKNIGDNNQINIS